MWQRIQTVWWLIAILAVAWFSLQDFAYYHMPATPNDSYQDIAHNAFGMSIKIGDSTAGIYTSWAVAILCGISVIISLVSIFIYKMRPYQIRLSVLNALVLVGLLGVILYQGYNFTSGGRAVFDGISVWLSMPLVAIVAQLLAARAVIQDELLVRMSNRLR